MIKTCVACGGTGDRFDEERGDWADPREDCPGCAGRGETAGPVQAERPVGLYDMGARITRLILAREQALSLLNRAPHDRYVLAAIAVLEDEPEPGERGGPARDLRSERFDAMPERISRAVVAAGAAPSLPPRADRQTLSLRLTQCAELIIQGMSNQEIADTLYLSIDTVKTHVRRLLAETGARNRTHLVSVLRTDAA